MYWQHQYLRTSVSMTRGLTYRVDLPESGLLSALLLKIEAPAVSGAFAAGGAWRLQDYLGKIEIIGNGSTVIKSLNFQPLQYVDWLRQGMVPPHWWRSYATNTQRETVMLLFGRYLWDTDYGLDLSKWDNVEFRFTNSATAATHGSDPTITIVQYFLRAKPGAFRGYIRSELWRQYTTAADQTQYFILPTEYPICGLYLRALPHETTNMTDTGFYNLMDNIVLSQQGGTLEMYNGALNELALCNHIALGHELLVSGQIYGNANVGWETSVGEAYGWSTGWGAKGGAAATVDLTMEADDNTNTLKIINAQADEVAAFMERGYSFQNMVYLIAELENNPDFVLDPKRDGECRLNIHTRNLAGAANGTNEVYLERIVPG